MKRDYITEKANNKKSTRSTMWLLLIFIALFVIIMVKIATRSGSTALITSMPSGDDAYQIALSYLKPTITLGDPEFPADEFQFTVRPDSTYNIKSFYNAGHPVLKVYYTIKVKYNGGVENDRRNWDLISMKESP